MVLCDLIVAGWILDCSDGDAKASLPGTMRVERTFYFTVTSVTRISGYCRFHCAEMLSNVSRNGCVCPGASGETPKSTGSRYAPLVRTTCSGTSSRCATCPISSWKTTSTTICVTVLSPALVIAAVDIADRVPDEILRSAHLEIGKLQAGNVGRGRLRGLRRLAQQKRRRRAPAITTATAITIIKRLESRSSATGVGWPRLPMTGIVGRDFGLSIYGSAFVVLARPLREGPMNRSSAFAQRLA